jgi:hypothetical protein
MIMRILFSFFAILARTRNAVKRRGAVPANWPITIGLTSLRPKQITPLFEMSPAVTKALKTASKTSGNIYIGIGGWTFEPWRGVFYPEKLTQAKELNYAASKLTSIEINGTYYGKMAFCS